MLTARDQVSLADVIAGGMIVGRGESLRWLDRTLRLASEWANELVVVTDLRADADTMDAVRVSDAHWLPSTLSFDRDESVLRNALMEQLDAVATDGDVIVIIDADEELVGPTGGSPKPALRALAKTDDRAWQARFIHVWAADRSVIRVDSGWAPSYATRIYRHRAGLRIAPRQLACTAVPDLGGTPVCRSALTFVHYGYARVDDRAAKSRRYAEIDGGRFHSADHLDSILDPDPTLEPYPWR